MDLSSQLPHLSNHSGLPCCGGGSHAHHHMPPPPPPSATAGPFLLQQNPNGFFTLVPQHYSSHAGFNGGSTLASNLGVGYGKNDGVDNGTHR